MTYTTKQPGKLGYVTPPEVRAKMCASSHHEGTFEFAYGIAHKEFEIRFPDAHPMKYKKGYNYIWDGQRIAVRAATVGSDHHWHYNINKNDIADQFCLMGFTKDTEFTSTDIYTLEVVHLIPGNLINHLTGISISSRNPKKWEAYQMVI